jgi:hypothetical protein
MSDDRFDNRRYHNEDTFSIQSTAGAVPVKNKKGEISMQKVKVSRYVSGKKPEYAHRGRRRRDSDSESDQSEDEDFTAHQRRQQQQQQQQQREESPDLDEEEAAGIPETFSGIPVKDEPEDVNDPRLKRLRAAKERFVIKKHWNWNGFMQSFSDVRVRGLL